MSITVLLFAGLLAAQSISEPAQAEAGRAPIHDGSFGLIVASFNFAATNANLTSTRACPERPALSFSDILNDTARAPDGRNLCQAPTAQILTPNVRTVQ